VAEKVALVEETKEAFGISLPARVLGLSCSTWYYRTTKHRSYEEKYQHLADPLEDIAREHSGYGYRRTKPELDEVVGYPVNHKVIRRLHGLWDLSLLRSIRRPKPGGVREAIEAAGDRANLQSHGHLSELRPGSDQLLFGWIPAPGFQALLAPFQEDPPPFLERRRRYLDLSAHLPKILAPKQP